MRLKAGVGGGAGEKSGKWEYGDPVAFRGNDPRRSTTTCGVAENKTERLVLFSIQKQKKSSYYYSTVQYYCCIQSKV